MDYNQIKIFKKIVKISFLLIFQIPILVIYLSTWITHQSVRLRFQKDFTQVHIIMLHTFFIYIWYTLHKSRFFLLRIFCDPKLIRYQNLVPENTQFLIKNSPFEFIFCENFRATISEKAVPLLILMRKSVKSDNLWSRLRCNSDKTWEGLQLQLQSYMGSKISYFVFLYS